MAVNIGLGYEAQLVGQVLQQRLIGAASWTTVDSPVSAAKYRLDGGGTIVRLHYIGPWSMSGSTVIGPTGNTTSSANFATNRTGSGGDWTDQSAAPNIQSIPTLTFNPILSISANSTTFAILDSVAVVTDGGNTLGAIRITLGPGSGSLGVVVGGALTTAGTIGAIAYAYNQSKRLLSLTSTTATGANFTQVLRLVAYSKGNAVAGAVQNVCVNLGNPIYSTETGHYYEVVPDSTNPSAAVAAASSKSFFGLTGYLATVTSQVENDFIQLRIGENGLLGGNSLATPSGTIGANRIWRWVSGPESGQVFWNGASTGLFTSWEYGNPSNSGQLNSTENLQPYMTIGGNGTWYDHIPDFQLGYYVEYSTASGTGEDGLAGTRSISSITVQSADTALIALLVQAGTAIEVSLLNGVVTSTIGVPMGNVTIGASNATHIQVSINLGVNTGGKRRQAQGFRIVGGSERTLISTPTRVGEVYNFVFLKTVDGSSSVNLVLN